MRKWQILTILFKQKREESSIKKNQMRINNNWCNKIKCMKKKKTNIKWKKSLKKIRMLKNQMTIKIKFLSNMQRLLNSLSLRFSPCLIPNNNISNLRSKGHMQNFKYLNFVCTLSLTMICIYTFVKYLFNKFKLVQLLI